ncbi:MAG: gluconeogenesis factor YvcK family protein [Parachlamydiales bacterium]
MRRKRVVVIGGGTGNFAVLQGLKSYDLDLTAVVSMADSGGSTGILRDELGVLPPGDVRQCLVALSNSSCLMRSLMNYRFENGGLEGHSFGNLLLSALEKVTGSFEKAVEEVGKILVIRGKVLPVTTNQVHLKMLLNNRQLLEGESTIYLSQQIDQGYKSIFLEPYPTVNPKVIEEIRQADLIVIGPGGIYTSIIPNLLVEKVGRSICESRAKKALVVNLMNKKGQTTGFKVSHNLKEVTRFLGSDVFNYILVNNRRPPKELLAAYSEEGGFVENDLKEERVILSDFLGPLGQRLKVDLIKRNLIRHDSDKLARELIKIVNHL